MHSSRPRSHGEKLLIDMDGVRKSFANYTGGEGGVGRAARDEKTRQDTGRHRGKDKWRDRQKQRYTDIATER